MTRKNIFSCHIGLCVDKQGLCCQVRTMLTMMLQGSILGTLLFLVYISDLLEGLESNVRIYVHDTSLFSVVHDPQLSSDVLNFYLSLIKLWEHQRKMSVKSEPSKQAVQLTFSRKRVQLDHPEIFQSMNTSTFGLFWIKS